VGHDLPDLTRRVERLDVEVEQRALHLLAHRSQALADALAWVPELVGRWATRRWWSLERDRNAR
jgi:Mg/Co/Ni transporter MgtE